MSDNRKQKTKKSLALSAADSAERTLPYFEKKYPDDNRPRNAIKAARAWAAGETTVGSARAAAFAAHAAARKARQPAAIAAARSAGHAAATAHVAGHAPHAAAYAAKAVEAASFDGVTQNEDKHAAAWERAYSKKRIAWRGTTNFAPKLPRGTRVLEIGCGNGKNLSALAGKGYDVYAIDYSPEAIALCKESPILKKERVKLKVMDARALEFKSGFFDAVVCFHVLGNMLACDRKKAAREAARVLKKDGKLFFKEFGARDFRFGKGLHVEQASFKRRTGIVTHYFEGKKEIERLFSGLDLTNFESERWTVHYGAGGAALPREEVHAIFIKH